MSIVDTTERYINRLTELLESDIYTLPYLQKRWKEMYGLTEEELTLFKSTGVLAWRKP